MSAHTPAPDTAFPAEGVVWRLEGSELMALGPIMPAEPAPGEPGGVYRPPAQAREYRSESYIAPFPATIYYGPWFGFAYGYPGYGLRGSHKRHPHTHARPWRGRR